MLFFVAILYFFPFVIELKVINILLYVYSEYAYKKTKQNDK